MAALACVAIALGIVIGAQNDGGSKRAHISANTSPAARPAHKATKPHHAQKPAPTTTSTVAATTTTSSAPSTATSASALEAQGHQLMLSGNYAAAIPVLRQAVASAGAGSLTYAYALFDLGHALRVSGDPRAAIPILYRRLQIPNQTDVVRRELQAALLAVGAQAQSNPVVPPAHDNGKHKGHGPKD
jgi:hypothetical protein